MSLAPVEIANPQAAELRLLFSLAKGTFSENPGWSDRRVLNVLERDVIFVAHEGDRPAGYVALRPAGSPRLIVVDQIFVAPGHEQRGIGRRLLAHAEGYAIASGADAVRIVVEEGNWRARALYRRLGFVPVEREQMELVLPRLPD
jgi:ribosomal protein S18 acetylase RimI-like enzyme